MTTYYIFDSNFFINLHEVFPQPIIKDLAQSIRSIDGTPYVTDQVIEEIKTLKYDRNYAVIDDVQKYFKVEQVKMDEVTSLESRIGKERSPQRTDLSLMVLTDRLGRTGTAQLISDDFKIHTTQEQYNLSYKMQSPAAFFLDISNKVPEGGNRQTYRRLYRHVRRKEMEYMLSRRDTYNIEPKMSWLVDNLLGAGSDTRLPEQSRIVSVGGDEEVDLAPVYRYIDGEKVRGSKLSPFQRILPDLEFLKETKGADEEVHILVENGELKDAIQVIRTASARLRRHLQEASLKVDENDGLKLRQVYAHYLAHYNFLQGFMCLSEGHMQLAEEYLDEAAFCALITRDNDDIVKASYVKSLIYFGMDDYSEAREQFQTTERLARILGNHEMEFRGTFGKSITAFLSGRKELAADAMGDVRRIVEEMGMDATMALKNFADHIYHFGKAEVALAIFNDALESAIEWGQAGDLEIIKDSIEECHISLNDAGVVVDVGLEELIDKANDLAASCRENYLKEVQEIAMKEAKEMKPLDVQVPDWTSGKDLPSIYKGWIEVVRFVPVRLPSAGEEGAEVMHTLVLGHIHGVGTLGIYLKGSEEHSAVEKFSVRLKEDGQFKVLDAPANYRRRYGIRGVVGPKDPAHIELKRLMAVPVGGKDNLMAESKGPSKNPQ